MSLRRLDAELVRRKLARSRDHAQELIEAGKVRLEGVRADKPARQVGEAASIVVVDEGPRWVSRGAYKLLGSLDAFCPQGLQVRQRRCLDAGASTGGFTQVLLRQGAASVVAVDVGYGQLDWSLRSDPRVMVMDRCNVRNLAATDLPHDMDLLVADLSFISLSLVIPGFDALMADGGDMVLMVKPQFEVGRQFVGDGGVVRAPELRASAVQRVRDVAEQAGWGGQGVVASSLPGPSGNVEYFLWLRRTANRVSDDMIMRAVEGGPA